MEYAVQHVSGTVDPRLGPFTLYAEETLACQSLRRVTFQLSKELCGFMPARLDAGLQVSYSKGNGVFWVGEESFLHAQPVRSADWQLELGWGSPVRSFSRSGQSEAQGACVKHDNQRKVVTVEGGESGLSGWVGEHGGSRIRHVHILTPQHYIIDAAGARALERERPWFQALRGAGWGEISCTQEAAVLPVSGVGHASTVCVTVRGIHVPNHEHAVVPGRLELV
jgi:hypothetical protein